MSNVQQRVEELLQRLVSEGTESGIQVAAYLNGKLIVDAWAAPGRLRIDGESLFPVFSVGKGIAATAIHILVERKILSWDDPIAKHWPEFAPHGKGNILLRHAMNHTAGMPHMPKVSGMEELRDWGDMCRRIAALKPLHRPGENVHYHAITYTWLLGETARRADGRDFARIIQEEVCLPLGIHDLYFGLPDSVAHRVVDVEAPPRKPPDPSAPPPDPIGARAVPPVVMPLEDFMNNPEVRRACVPASNGIMNARSIARHYASLLGNGIDGVKLLRDETLQEATRRSGKGTFGLGYGLSGPDDDPGAVFGHGGYGGSNGFADRRVGLAIGIAKNFTSGGAGPDAIVKEIRNAIG